MPRKRCRDIMLGLLSATPSVGSVIWRSGMNGAGGIPFSGEVGTPLSLDEARAVVRGAETGEMGTVPKERAFDISKCTLTLWSIEEVYINE